MKSSKKSYTDADLTAIKEEYEKKMQQKVEEHQEALDQARQDMAIVISSLKQGSSSDTIMDLQGKIKDLEQELEDIRGDYEEQLEELELKFKRSESKNFFALRRNEEMGGKIYQMQNELEELDRKHSLEIQIYQEKLSSLGKLHISLIFIFSSHVLKVMGDFLRTRDVRVTVFYQNTLFLKQENSSHTVNSH